MSKVYDYVTERIIKQLEEGTIPWRKPWNGGFHAVNYITRKPYRGINTFLLERSGEYLSFKQIQQLKGSLKKGAKAEMVVFYKIDKKIEQNEDGEKVTKKTFILRYYNVFHLSDVEGIPSKLEVIENDPIDEAEKIIKGYTDCPPIKHTNKSQAFYVPVLDYINIPEINQYKKVEEYYSTAFHEMVHSTGHQKRLNRSGVTELAAFGSETYSNEELVAEIGAAMLCGKAGIENSTIENSTAYIASWLKKLRNDKTLIIKAAAQAQKACDYIINIKFDEAEEVEPGQ